MIVLSENFFGKPWAETEKETLKSQMIEGEKLIIPLWHEVSKSDVMGYDPIIAGILAEKIHEGNISEVSNRIYNRIKPGGLASPTVGILVTAPHEYDMVARFIDNPEPDYHRSTRFLRGKMKNEGLEWEVVLRKLGQGPESIVLNLVQMHDEYDLDIVFLLGTAGGIKNVSVGDVVVADTINEYVDHDSSEEGLISISRVRATDYGLIEDAEWVRDQDWHSRCLSEDCNVNPDVHIDPIISTPTVIKDPSIFPVLRQCYVDGIAVVMEGSEFYQASRSLSSVQRLAIFGITDQAHQVVKREDKKSVASKHAFLFIKNILSSLSQSS